MTNVLTTWRTNIQALLTSTFPSAEVDGEIFPGEMANLSRDHDRIRVFSQPLTADSGNVNNANPKLTVHYFLKLPVVSGLTAEVPRDPAVVEQLMIDLATMFKAHLTGEGVDYYHVQSISPDRELYAVEAVLVGWTRNPAESGG